MDPCGGGVESRWQHSFCLIFRKHTIFVLEYSFVLLTSGSSRTRVQPLQVVEHALSVVCNLGAGTAAVKAHLGEADVIPVLLHLVAPAAEPGIAQLAALSLRNLSKLPKCKQQIVNSGGVQTLLDFLSEGLEVLQYPLICEVR
jgi:hypothetical protein